MSKCNESFIIATVNTSTTEAAPGVDGIYLSDGTVSGVIYLREQKCESLHFHSDDRRHYGGRGDNFVEWRTSPTPVEDHPWVVALRNLNAPPDLIDHVAMRAKDDR